MTLDELQQRIAQMQLNLQNTIGKVIPMKVANRAVKLFKDNFQTESFFGEKWKDVRRRTHPPKRTKYPANRLRKILTGRTGNLGRSIRWRINGNTITVYSGLAYSRVHNEGAKGVGRRHRATIPQRRFIGPHQQITSMVQRTIEDEINKVFKKI